MTAAYDIRKVAQSREFNAEKGVTVESNDDWFVYDSSQTEIILKHKHTPTKLRIEQRKPTMADLPFRVYKIPNKDADESLIDDSDYFNDALKTALAYADGFVDCWKHAQNKTENKQQ